MVQPASVTTLSIMPDKGAYLINLNHVPYHLPKEVKEQPAEKK
jgi:hypothetical protein